jgi:glycosyltransferase involved in cell wall biosynthesis
VSAKPRLAAEFHGLSVDALDLLPLGNRRLLSPAAPFNYDVVVATAPGIGTQAQLLARQRGIPFVAVHTTDLPRYADALTRARLGALPGAAMAGGFARRGSWRYLEWLYSETRTDLVLVPTRAVAEELRAHVGAPVEILGRGADTMTFPAIDRPRRKVPRVLYVGRIDYGQKNLAALERVVREIEDVELWAVGGGDDLALMRERLADEIARGRVRLTGRVDDPETLSCLYLSADVFAFPSTCDTLGQVVLEAQRAGLPVVVRDRGGPRELVRAMETGFVTPDDDAFVARVRQLAASPDLRRRMGHDAKAHADALPSWDDVVSSLLRRLAGLVSEHVEAERLHQKRISPPARAVGVSGH